MHRKNDIPETHVQANVQVSWTCNGCYFEGEVIRSKMRGRHRQSELIALAACAGTYDVSPYGESGAGEAGRLFR